MRAGNSSDNGVGSCINFFRVKADAEFVVFVENLTVYHGKLYVLFAAAVNEVFDQIIFRLHVRLVQINHDEIRLFANGETVTVIDLHRVCAACGCHVEYRISRDSCGVHLTDFGKTGGQEHFAEHVEAVVAGRSVGADGEVDAVIVKTFQRADAGRELQVGGWIGNGRQFPVAENFEIAVLHPDAVVAAASVLEHA